MLFGKLKYRWTNAGLALDGVEKKNVAVCGPSNSEAP
jgi:hypothetical protein